MTFAVNDDELSSWRSGDTRDALVGFLENANEFHPYERVAVLDNDGTLWCERPNYNQFEFINWAVQDRIDNDPTFNVPETLKQVAKGGGQIPPGLQISDIAHAVDTVFSGLTPRQFNEVTLRFRGHWTHPKFGALEHLRYAPMLELITALNRRDFDVFIVTAGGIEFVRSVSHDFYGVKSERVVGSLVGYNYDTKNYRLERGSEMVGPYDEGSPKVGRMQQMIGRRPVFAAGNSAGDQEMLDFVLNGDGPTMSILINHDDADREYAYSSVAASFADGDDIVSVGRRAGWQIVSMKSDWSQIFSTS